MRFKHIISVRQFLDTGILNEIFELADEMEKGDKANKLEPVLKGKVLATVFYEPSTRTRFSFESAMHKLGGNVITTENAPYFSSVSKGETLQDTIKVISGYVDAIVLRHQEEGSAKIASEVSSVPIINAGDGSGEHPTQALLDLYTIRKELGRVDNFEIGLVGDLLHGRTIHSLIYLLALYKKVKIYLISLRQLKLPEKYKEHLTKNKIEFEELTGLQEALNKIDVLYIIRIQKERFKSQQDYDRMKNSYIIEKENLKQIKDSAIIMHPLPRVNEISSEIDNDKRAVYFKQAQNGLYIRMALLQLIFNSK